MRRSDAWSPERFAAEVRKTSGMIPSRLLFQRKVIFRLGRDCERVVARTSHHADDFNRERPRPDRSEDAGLKDSRSGKISAPALRSRSRPATRPSCRADRKTGRPEAECAASENNRPPPSGSRHRDDCPARDQAGRRSRTNSRCRYRRRAAATRPRSIRHPATPPVAAGSAGKIDVAVPAPDISRAENEIRRQHPRRIEPGISCAQVGETLDQQSRASEKEKRQGHLRNHEHTRADDVTRVPRRRGSLPAERHSRPVASPAAPARARREACSRRATIRVKKPTARVDLQFAKPRHVLRSESAEQVHAPPGEQEAAGRA